MTTEPSLDDPGRGRVEVRFYGVSSWPLGTGSIDQTGPNAGFHELASGHEVVAHFDAVLRHRFLPSGRVTFLSSSEVDDDGVVTSLLSGARRRVEYGRFVDATHSRMQVPATTPPPYAVADGVTCVPVGRLPAAQQASRTHRLSHSGHRVLTIPGSGVGGPAQALELAPKALARPALPMDHGLR